MYQVNLSRRLEAPSPSQPELRRLLAALALRAGAPFSAHLEQPGRVVLSASPESFLRVPGARVEASPIKGTRPRGRTPAEDESLRKALEASAKDRAEHVMIVDLERNDLGRICETASVRVTRLCETGSFSDVHHLVSSVDGWLRDPDGWCALPGATFPGGSITGAIGLFDSSGGIDLSLAIRTAVAKDGLLQLHLGGGICADSDAREELRETRDKGRAFARSWGFES